MSTAAVTGPLASLAFDRSATPVPQQAAPRTRVVRRRGSLQQGRSLELLGHSIEYLMDSRVFERDADTADNDREAVQMLMRLSRLVFEECPEIVPMRTRLGRCLGRWMRRRQAHA